MGSPSVALSKRNCGFQNEWTHALLEFACILLSQIVFSWLGPIIQISWEFWTSSALCNNFSILKQKHHLFICFVERGGVDLMLKEYTRFVASSTFLKVLPFLGTEEFKSPAQKIGADRAQLRLAEITAVQALPVHLASGQKHSGRRCGKGRPE